MAKQTRKTARQANEELHPLVALARLAVEAYVQERAIIGPPAELTPEMAQCAGVFVCLKCDGDLRGCIGTFEPTQRNVAEEIIHNAISAAVHDPRFAPVAAAELPNLTYAVDILTAPVRIQSRVDLDPKQYGVIVRSGFRRGLLLPDLEGVDTVHEQLRIARYKAGIAAGEPIEILKFAVRRYQ